MTLTDSFLGTLKVTLSVGVLLYLFFILMLMPILPVEDNSFEKYTPPYIILLASGIFGLVFIGGLSIFTLSVLYKYKMECN